MSQKFTAKKYRRRSRAFSFFYFILSCIAGSICVFELFSDGQFAISALIASLAFAVLGLVSIHTINLGRPGTTSILRFGRFLRIDFFRSKDVKKTRAPKHRTSDDKVMLSRLRRSVDTRAKLRSAKQPKQRKRGNQRRG